MAGFTLDETLAKTAASVLIVPWKSESENVQVLPKAHRFTLCMYSITKLQWALNISDRFKK